MAASGTNPKIVLSYRRTDAAMAGRIFDRLVQHFGKSSLFIDIDNVPFGVDFRKHIDDALKTSDLLIAVVGRNWVGAQSDGKARIMNEADKLNAPLNGILMLSEDQADWQSKISARPCVEALVQPIKLKQLLRKIQEMDAM